MARSIRPASGAGGGVFRMVERTGLRKGVAGSKGWFYVGTGLWTVRTLRRMAARQEELLISEELKPGQRIVISNERISVEGTPTSAPTGRRASRKAAKAQARAEADAAKRAAKAQRSRAARRAQRKAAAAATDA
jgi:hypothetical protein